METGCKNQRLCYILLHKSSALDTGGYWAVIRLLQVNLIMETSTGVTPGQTTKEKNHGPVRHFLRCRYRSGHLLFADQRVEILRTGVAGNRDTRLRTLNLR